MADAAATPVDDEDDRSGSSSWTTSDDDSDEAGDEACEDDVVQDAAWTASAERFQAALQAICDKYTAAASAEQLDGDGLTVDEIVDVWGAARPQTAPTKEQEVEQEAPADTALRRRPPVDKAEQQHALLMSRFEAHVSTHAISEISVNELCAVLGVNRAGSAVAHTLAAVKPRLVHAMQQGSTQGLTQEQGGQPLLRTGARGLLILSCAAVVSFFIPELASRELKLC
jgi:hypothetical protein